MDDLDPSTALEQGGWDPRYAVVLDVATVGDHAAALVDTNGDGADVNVDVYRRAADGGWEEVASGNGSHLLPDVRVTWIETSEGDRLEIVPRT